MLGIEFPKPAYDSHRLTLILSLPELRELDLGGRGDKLRSSQTDKWQPGIGDWEKRRAQAGQLFFANRRELLSEWPRS